MHHESTDLSRTLPTLVGRTDTGQSIDLLAPHRRPRTLIDLVRRFEEDEALENPDQVVPISDLRCPDGEAIEVPKLGVFGFTGWSRRQAGVLLGIRMERWFENASAAERADELNRRFRRATGKVRVRTTLDGAEVHGGGTLQALVSPGYTPVKDSLVASMLAEALAPTDPEQQVIRWHATEVSTGYVVKVGEAFRPGDCNEVGDVFGCLHVRNSNVGFASLLVTLHVVRVLCTNGMTAPIADPVLLRRRHTSLGEDRLREMLTRRFDRLPARFAEGAEKLRTSRERTVSDIESTLSQFLIDADLSRRHLPALVSAYAAEPHPSAFGIAQAVTRAAQALDPEPRFEFERAAGNYVAAASSE